MNTAESGTKEPKDEAENYFCMLTLA